MYSFFSLGSASMCAPTLMDDARCFDIANASDYLGTVCVSELPKNIYQGFTMSITLFDV